jgi:hypothetical protein
LARRPGAAAVTLLASLTCAACSTLAEAPRLTVEQAALVRPAPVPRFKAWLECPPNETSDPRASAAALAAARRVLSRSAWFESLDATRDEADVWIHVHPIESTPYFHRPAHNPGAIILALVIPMGWKEAVGCRWTVVVRESGSAVEIDTRRQASAYAWSLAPLMNLSPDWGFGTSVARELAPIHVQLLPLLAL